MEVRRLLPGHCMVVTPADVKIYRWWHTLDHLVTPPSSLAQQAAHFRELFEDACRLRMRSDVPIGTCLSGGLDSSAIVCMLADIARREAAGEERRASDWQRAFIATFPNTPVDERAYADLVVAQTGVQPDYVTPTPSDFLSHIDDAVYHLEGLDAGPMIPLWVLYRQLRRRGVVVTLDGHGGDELLGGYVSHVLHALHDAGRPRRHPGRYLQLIDTYRAMFRPSSGAMQPDRPLRQLVVETNAWAKMATRATGWRPRRSEVSPADQDVAPFASPEALALARTPAPPYVWPGAGHLEAALYREFHQTMLPTILRNYDRMSMAHGVEVRMPFMDWRLVTYVFSLPPESKIGQGYTKLVLREAMRGLLPEGVRTRRDKIGFAPPMVQWFEGELRPWLYDLVNSQEAAQSPIGVAPYLKQQLERSASPYSWNSLTTLWPSIQALLWTTVFERQIGNR
jgi:asparagine synthase (glutamine-hydrolysing)